MLVEAIYLPQTPPQTLLSISIETLKDTAFDSDGIALICPFPGISLSTGHSSSTTPRDGLPAIITTTTIRGREHAIIGDQLRRRH